MPASIIIQQPGIPLLYNMQNVIMMDLLHYESLFMPNSPGIDSFSCALIKNFRYFMQNNTNSINIHNQLLLKVYSFKRTNKKGTCNL